MINFALFYIASTLVAYILIRNFIRINPDIEGTPGVFIIVYAFLPILNTMVSLFLLVDISANMKMPKIDAKKFFMVKPYQNEETNKKTD